MIHRLVGIFLIVITLFFHAAAFATLPRHFHFQSRLSDEGGNPLPDGEHSVIFRLSSNEALLYEEEQRVTVINQSLSAMIGDGYAVGGDFMEATGGLPIETLSGDVPLFLQVLVDGKVIFDRMEFSSVPFSFYSQQALSVAEESIYMNHLSPALKKSIFGTLTPGTYSHIKSDSLDGALKDLDLALRFQEEAAKQNKSALDSLTFADIGGMAQESQIDPLIARKSEISDINQIAGILSDNKIASTITRNNQIADINMIAGILSDSKIAPTITRNNQIANINQIPGVLSHEKLPADVVVSSQLPQFNTATLSLSNAATLVKEFEGNLPIFNNLPECTVTTGQIAGSAVFECLYKKIPFSYSATGAFQNPQDVAHPIAIFEWRPTGNQISPLNARAECCDFLYEFHHENPLYYIARYVRFTINGVSPDNWPSDLRFNVKVYDWKP